MKLQTVTTEELVRRFAVLSEAFDIAVREIGPLIQELGKLELEMDAISEELKNRDA